MAKYPDEKKQKSKVSQFSSGPPQKSVCHHFVLRVYHLKTHCLHFLKHSLEVEPFASNKAAKLPTTSSNEKKVSPKNGSEGSVCVTIRIVCVVVVVVVVASIEKKFRRQRSDAIRDHDAWMIFLKLPGRIFLSRNV